MNLSDKPTLDSRQRSVAVDAREAQMAVRHALVNPRLRLDAIQRMIHEYGPVREPQAEAWARELEEFADTLKTCAALLRESVS